MNGLLFKKYRKTLNMTQKEVAEYMNITQSAYSLWELGKRVPDAHQLLKLSELFNCTPNDLYGIHGAMSIAIDPLFEEYKEFVKKIKK